MKGASDDDDAATAAAAVILSGDMKVLGDSKKCYKLLLDSLNTALADCCPYMNQVTSKYLDTKMVDYKA